jgi:hypothetical protein
LKTLWSSQGVAILTAMLAMNLPGKRFHDALKPPAGELIRPSP